MERYTRSYLQLIKPGITLSNTLSAVAGFFLASSMVGFMPGKLVGVIGGIALVIASACVVNNIIDRDIDVRMKRTKKREIASGTISVQTAAVFATILGAIGFGVLIILTNALTAALGVLAYLWYVVIYGIAKRTTPLSTVVGGVCGALPPVAGYTAVTGRLDEVAVVLFLLLMVWQLPHFYAISLFRGKEYAKAKLPVWAVRYGGASTRHQMILWIIVFVCAAPLLTFIGKTGVLFAMIMVTIGLYWLTVSIVHRTKPDDVWARQVFGASLIVLLLMLLAISIGGYLP
jgi:heme o synthase